MKKIVGIALVSLLTLIIVPARAQIHFGIKGGVNISSVHFNSDIVSSDNITGFSIGPMLEIMAPYTGVGVDVAVLYSQKGMGMVNNKPGSDQTTDYIDIPVNFKWKVGIPLIKAYVAAGPYIGIKVDGEKVWDIPNVVGGTIKTKSFGAGLNFGLGAEVLERLQVGFNYGVGLTNNYSGTGGVNNESFSGKHRGWAISAALLF
jgi:hypothetical protein